MKNGFTLIELLAIMVLLGIIIVVAVPSLIVSNKKAAEKSDQELAQTINTACESYVQAEKADKVTALLNDGTSFMVTIDEIASSEYLKSDIEGIDYGTSIEVTNSDGEIKCNYSK